MFWTPYFLILIFNCVLLDCDMETKSLLESWDIPDDIIKNFIDNGITMDHFKDLTDGLLKELCPHIGHRIKIRNEAQDLLDATAETEPCTTDAQSSQDSDATEGSAAGVSRQSRDIFKDISSSFNRPALPEFDLKTLLQTSAHGNSILNHYNQYHLLSTKKKNMLTDIIIKHIYTYTVNNKLKPEDYNILGAKIISVFPCETLDTYYVKAIPTPKSLTGKYVPAKGKLVDKVRNLLFISGEKRRSSAAKNNITASGEELSETEILDDDDVLWLKNNTDPWEDVISKWKKTFRLRVGYTNPCTVHDFLENWSILKTDKGHVLINSDFEELFKEKALNFHKNWHDFFAKLLILKKGQVNNKNALSLIETLSAITDEDKKIPVQMSILAYLIPPKGRLSRSVKYSSADATEGLIVQTDTAGDIDNTIKKQKSKNLARNLSVQPYILLQGSLHNFTCLYMVIDDVKYVFNCASKAFDLLFKMYHVFHVRYPNASEYLYLTIQRKVYGIVTKYDRVPPHVVEILNMK